MPRDVVRFLGHPLHASMVHLPLGLLAIAPLWDGLALAGVAGPWWAIGFWTVAAGLALALLAATIGLADLLRAVEGEARGTAILHLLANVSAVLCFGGGMVARGGAEPPPGRGVTVLALDALGFVLIGLGGWLGGELVFRHGIGRRDGSGRAPGDR